MGRRDKKTAKGRLDRYYHLAKEQGYRSRAAFKLIQLNKKYNFLSNAKVCIDLCAAPGGWLQVAAKYMSVESLIIGVDLVPIKSIPNVITLAEDITSSKCRAALRQHLKTWKADLVLHDGAGNVGSAWIQDAYSQAVLVLSSLKLATEFLMPGGMFVTKVFRSKDYNKLIWVLTQLFKKVEATKPPSSRNVSAEIFVVCHGYKAPIKLDPKFLDPHYVFEDVDEKSADKESLVFHPEKRKRAREGYGEDDYTLYKEIAAEEFIKTEKPIDMLGTYNRLTFNTAMDLDIRKHLKTTEEILACCRDLKVLGKKDFKGLLKWRLTLREAFGQVTKKDEDDGVEKVTVTPLTEEEMIDQELQHLQEKELVIRKKERRKANEKKTKAIMRMQMNMETPAELGLEQQSGMNDEIFGVKRDVNERTLNKFADADISDVENPTSNDHDADICLNMNSDAELDELDENLEQMYAEFTERKAQRDRKHQLRLARQNDENDEFEGFNDDETLAEKDNVDTDSSQSEDDESNDNLVSFHKMPNDNSLSKQATVFFDSEDFKDIDLGDSEPVVATSTFSSSETEKGYDDGDLISTPKLEEDNDDDGSSDSEVEIVPRIVDTDSENWRYIKQSRANDIDIITAEAMTLAQSIAQKDINPKHLLDDGFNKYSFRDKDGLPQWFLDDENQHSKLQKPITAAAVAAIKEKLRALNARPIKKVAEAKARKKMRAITRVNKLQKKAEHINEQEDLTEKEKADNIQRMIRRVQKGGKASVNKKQVKLVVAKGDNRGQKGRPRGVKGRYKMVDARLKKEVRAAKRKAKQKKR